jgi:hypothetical protein
MTRGRASHAQHEQSRIVQAMGVYGQRGAMDGSNKTDLSRLHRPFWHTTVSPSAAMQPQLSRMRKTT